MAHVIGYVKTVNNGTFFVKDAKGNIHQLKAGTEIHDGELVYGASDNAKDAQIIVDVTLQGAGDLVIAGNGALHFDSSVLEGIFNHHDAVVYINSVQDAIAAAEPKKTMVATNAEGDVTDAGETAAGDAVTDTERAADLFAARTGAVGDVTTGLLNPIGGMSGPIITDASPVILEGIPTVQVGNAETAVGDITVNEGDDAIFGILVTNVAAGGNLTLTLADGTALSPEDYPNSTFQYSTDGGVTWTDYTGAAIPMPTGDSMLQVKVGTFDDVLDETDETFVLGATLNSNGVNYSDIGTATILDDNDTAYTLKLFAVVDGEYVEANSMNEEGSVSYVVLAVDGNGDPLTTQPGGTVTVNVTDGTATSADDYNSIASRTETIGTEFTISAKDDVLAEDNEQFTLSLQDGSWSNDATYENVAYQGTVTTTITDDNDTAFTFKLFASDAQGNIITDPSVIYEDGETSTYYVVKAVDSVGDPLTTQPTGTVGVTFTNNGTTTNADYTHSATVTVGSAFSSTAVDDVLADDGETFTVSLNSDSWSGDASVYENVGYDAATVTTTITDDDVWSPAGTSVDETGGLDTVTITGGLSANLAMGQAGYVLSATDATWVQATNSLTANDGSWKITVDQANGSYTFTQLKAMKHLDTLDPNDQIDLTISVSAVDSGGVTLATQPITVSVYDDASSVNPNNAVISNEKGNTISGVSLDLDGGTDTAVSISLTPATLNGFAVDTNNAYLTSTVGGVTYKLVYVQGTDGIVTAYQATPGTAVSNGQEVFTLTPDLASGTYSVSIDGVFLDGASQEISVNYNTGGYSGGNELVLAFPIPDDTPDNVYDNLFVVATANSGYKVNYNASEVGGLGVADKTTINSSEILTLNFTDTNVLTADKKAEALPNAKDIAIANPLNMSTADFVLTKLDTGETASWNAYSGGLLVASDTVSGTSGKTAATTVISEVDLSSIVLGSGTGGTWSVNHTTGVISFVSDGGSDTSGAVAVTYTINGIPVTVDGSDPVLSMTDSGTVDMSAFNSVEFTAVGASDYSVLSMHATVSSETIGTDHSINIDVAVTDGDGDVALDSMVVTFDGNGTIEGTTGDDSILFSAGRDIDGDSGTDTLILATDADINFSLLDDGALKNIEVIDLSQNGDHSLTNLSIGNIIDMTTADPVTGHHTLTITGDSIADSVNLPSISGTTYNVSPADTTTEVGFEIYTFTDSAGIDPTVVLKIETPIDTVI